jgi:hypothetical protein
LPLPQETTPILVRYLLTCEISTMPQEIRDNFWWYVDVALGYEFWCKKRDELHSLTTRNYESLDTNR